MVNVFRATVGVVLATVLLSYAPPPAPAPLRAAEPAAVKSVAGISLPAVVELQPGRLGRVPVTADARAKVVRWVNANPEGLDLIESETGRWAIVSAPAAGTYRVFAYTAIDGEPTPAAVCVVRVTGNPGPTPPVPPVPPDPTPPDPTNPLTKKLQAAYDRDPPDCAGMPKAACKDKLWRVYGSAAATDLTLYRTAGELFGSLKEAAKTLELPAAALPETRKAIAAELREVLPTDPDAALNQDHRANAMSLFKRLVKSLGEVK